MTPVGWTIADGEGLAADGLGAAAAGEGLATLPAPVVGCCATGAGGAAVGPHAAATSVVSAAPLAPLSNVRRSMERSSTQRPSPMTTGAAAPELGAQSDGPQCDGGFAVSSGLIILPAIK